VKIVKTGSVRVDLLGGTLDLNPINLILENVVTLNVATSLKAKVELEKTDKEGVEIVSLDYKSNHYFSKKDFTPEKLRGDYFGPMAFVCQILDEFNLRSHLKVTLQSGSPAGAGLGGSSAMGVTLYGAISDFLERPVQIEDAIKIVNSIEARILDSGPAGYQDYYPAMYGGVLALHPEAAGVRVEQLFSEELKKNLEKRITLVYSGQTRLSGINNWEVYKKFFDKVPVTREGLTKISELSFRAYEAIMASDWDELVKLIGQEGATRRELFPGILSSSMASIHSSLQEELPEVGIKVCGAGGGGCFLFTHGEADKELVESKVREVGMTILPFEVEKPLITGEAQS
jgi:D-glycero-alpha-D-manno-heptose-7-phosphate kinase